MIASIMTLTVSAQELVHSKFFDNTFVGVNIGMGGSLKSDKSTVKGFDGDNPFMTVGVNIGKWVTPSFGGEFTYDYNHNMHETFGSSSFLGANLLFNLSNAIGGYKGEPRTWEFMPFIGGGWYHTHDVNTNNIAARTGLKVVLNVDKAKAWQVHVTPSVNYVLTDNGIYNQPTYQPRFDVNRSWVDVKVGVIYKFKTSNKTHNFKYSDKKYTQAEIDVYVKNNKDLMNDVNRLKELSDKRNKENDTLKAEMNKLKEQIEMLLAKNKELESVTHHSVSTVGFEIGKDEILRTNRSNILNIVDLLTNEKDAKVVLTGFSDAKTGSKNRNMKLSISRAEKVKDALVKLGVDADRITVNGMGDTVQPFAENFANRVVISVVKY